MKLSILIPALNEEKKIGTVIQKIPKSFEGVSEVRIIVVNDGSTDKTSEIAKKNGALVIDNKKNLGLGKAFAKGLQRSLELKSDILVTIDADDQFDSNEITKIIKPIIEKKADFVSGSRFKDKKFAPKNIPFVKKYGNIILAKILSAITRQKLTDVSCGFRAYGKEAILSLNLFGKFTYTQETILDLAYKGLVLTEVPVSVVYYPERKSRIAHSILNYAFKTSNIILRTIKDYRPLKFFGLTGFFILIIGVVISGAVFIYFLQSGTFSPYKVIGFLGAFLTTIGLMIIFIGILADIIDKIRLTQEKILYLEKKKIYEK